MNCPNCNGEVQEGQKFCASCGTPLQMEKKRICPNCGSELDENAKFCPSCGLPVASVEAQNYPVYSGNSNSANLNPPPAGSASFYVEYEEQRQNRNRMYIWIAIGVTCVILAAIGCVFIGDYMAREKKAKQLIQEIELMEAAKHASDSAK